MIPSMARKVKGYVELYWKCSSCGNENLGSHAYCTSCGSPQPKTVEFHQGSKQQLLTDAEKIRRAKAGADIHCGFCGTRNPVGTPKCAQCGADLKEGLQRAGGRVVGAFAEGAIEPIKCANCGTLNASTRLKCGNCGAALSHATSPKTAAAAVAAKPIDRNVLFIAGGVLLFICAAIYFLFIRTSAVVGTVTTVYWTRSIAIEAFAPVRMEDWADDLPTDARNVSCREEVSVVQSEPPASGRYDEVCGTPYNVDTGGGFAEVVQDCEYQVYEDYCSYTVDAWAPVTTVEVEGTGLNARWPAPALTSSQRLGERSASYACLFSANGREYTFTTDSFEQFAQCQVGSQWNLEVNSLGAVVSITPVN